MGSLCSQPAEIIAPQPGPQALLVSCPCDDILYGGARGGGKSYGILIDWCAHESRWGKYARGILFRRTFPELEDMQVKAMEIFTAVGGRYFASPRTWVFPSGATLKMRYLDRDADAANYQGHEYNWMGFDEAGSWPSPAPLDMLRACLRSAHGVSHRLVHSCNPGGVGHNWVKGRYIDPAPALTPFKMDGFTRVFIPAKVQDNRKLMQNDPGYIDRLRQTGAEWLVKAWLEGDWDIVAGGAFDDIWRRDKHVLPRFDIPASWRIDRSFDWGSSKPFSVGWWAESDGTECVIGGVTRHFPRGTLIRVAEYYGWNGKPNEGLKMLAVDVAKKILKMETELFPGRKVKPGPADSSIYDVENGTGIGQDMEKIGAYWERADKRPGSRKSGFEAVRKMLAASLKTPLEEPGLFVTENCTHFIRTIPVLPRSERDMDDIDTNAEDHVYDEVRYRCTTPKRFVCAS